MPGTDTRWTVVLNRFPQIMDGLDRKVEAIVAKAALDIEANAKSVVPVDTGTLKNSIQGTQITPMHWRVTVGADYGIYVEMGTRFMAPRPYFAVSIDKVRPQFIAAMRRAL